MKLAKHGHWHGWPVETFDLRNNNVLQSNAPLVIYCYMCDKFLTGDPDWVAQYTNWLQEHGETPDFAFGIRRRLFDRANFWSKRNVDIEATHVDSHGQLEVIWKLGPPRIPRAGLVISSVLVAVWFGLVIYFFNGL